MPRPVHFEINASDPTASRASYEGVFGWRFQQWGELPDWVVSTGDTVARPRAAMAGVGWLAYVKDPDGNLLGLMQADPSAA